MLNLSRRRGWMLLAVIAVIFVVVVVSFSIWSERLEDAETDPEKMSLTRLSKYLLKAAEDLTDDYNEESFKKFHGGGRIWNEKYAGERHSSSKVHSANSRIKEAEKLVDCALEKFQTNLCNDYNQLYARVVNSSPSFDQIPELRHERHQWGSKYEWFLRQPHKSDAQLSGLQSIAEGLQKIDVILQPGIAVDNMTGLF